MILIYQGNFNIKEKLVSGTGYFPHVYENLILFATGKIISHCYLPYMIELQAIGSINYLFK